MSWPDIGMDCGLDGGIIDFQDGVLSLGGSCIAVAGCSFPPFALMDRGFFGISVIDEQDEGSLSVSRFMIADSLFPPFALMLGDTRFN